jgi:hypothetical protein
MQMIAFYKYLNDLEAIDRSQLMHTSLSNNAGFLEKYPFMVDKLARLKETTDTFSVAYHEALTKDVVKVERRKTQRENLNSAMGSVGQFVVAAAGEDPSVLEGTGIEIKRKRNANSHPELQAPSNFTLRHGATRGTMVGKASKLDGAGGFEMWVSEVDPTLEEGWKLWDTYLGCTMEMSGFQPGKNYSFRLRGIGSNNKGPWSPVISLISI